MMKFIINVDDDRFFFIYWIATTNFTLHSRINSQGKRPHTHTPARSKKFAIPDNGWIQIAKKKPKQDCIHSSDRKTLWINFECEHTLYLYNNGSIKSIIFPEFFFAPTLIMKKKNFLTQSSHIQLFQVCWMYIVSVLMKLEKKSEKNEQINYCYCVKLFSLDEKK